MTNKKFAGLIQIVKFGLIGVSNTIVDFALLNFLMWVFKITSGSWMIVFNIVAFSAAVINSYVWNRFWTFKIKSREEVPEEFVKFLLISLVGALINSGIVFSGTTYFAPLFSLSAGLWANGVKLIATGVAMVWNFIGYKLWAFKK
ncbi:GtrA family protein [Patescibacteria group bacterium]|nr:GtrA family protein [Patescibacteria group bacterium]